MVKIKSFFFPEGRGAPQGAGILQPKKRRASPEGHAGFRCLKELEVKEN